MRTAVGLGRLITAEGYGHTFDIMASGFLRTGQWGRGGARLAVGRSAARCERARSRATEIYDTDPSRDARDGLKAELGHGKADELPRRAR